MLCDGLPTIAGAGGVVGWTAKGVGSLFLRSFFSLLTPARAKKTPDRFTSHALRSSGRATLTTVYCTNLTCDREMNFLEHLLQPQLVVGRVAAAARTLSGGVGGAADPRDAVHEVVVAAAAHADGKDVDLCRP